MYIDSHVHLQPHGEQPPITRERIDRYVESARAKGVEKLAFTEHLFRFQEAYDRLCGWWEDERADPALAAATQAYWQDHVSGTLADYARVIEAAKSTGLPVLLGIELDWVPGRADDLHAILEPYDWDIVLGSVHWIGAWGFDVAEEPARSEWDRRDVDGVFSDYANLIRDLAASGLCHVLAHPDLPKLFGHRPSGFTPLHAAIVDAATAGQCAVEVNSNGYSKPVAEPYPALPVLERARAAGLPITLASDAHVPERVGRRFADIVAWAAWAGYREYVSFESGEPISHPLPAETPAAADAQPS